MKRMLCVLFALAGCYSPNVPNGQLKCSTVGNKCPEGFHCATDGTCWKNGSDPTVMVDMAQVVIPDMSQPQVDAGNVVTAQKGGAVLSGAVTAKSEHYKVIMSTGQAPAGNVNSTSTNYKKKAGVVGATQK